MFRIGHNPVLTMRNCFIYIVSLINFLLPIPMAGETYAQTPKPLFATGKWMKMETSNTGIHKISFDWLKNAGFQHPENVRIFGSANVEMARSVTTLSGNTPVQIPIFKLHESSGNDALLFFVQGDLQWSYNPLLQRYISHRNPSSRGKSYFFLTDDSGSDLQLPVASSPTGNPERVITSSDENLLWGDDNINLLESGQQWFSSMMMGGNVLSKSFQLPDRIEGSPLHLSLSAAAKGLSATYLDISLNGQTMGAIHFKPAQASAESDFAIEDSLNFITQLSGSAMQLALKFNGSPTDQCWLDQTILSFRRNLIYRSAPLLFRNGNQDQYDKIIEYHIVGANPGLQLWDVTNPLAPSTLPYTFSNGTLSFRTSEKQLHQYLLFDAQSSYPGVNKIADLSSSNLWQMVAPQYLIVTPPEFRSQAERLAQYHITNDHLSVAVVTTEEIFNEFAGGYRDVSAIRDFVGILSQQKNEAGGELLKYLLLFGKGTCDPVHETGENNPNWIPSAQSENSLNPINSFSSDDFFADFGPLSGSHATKLTIGIGRIPAATKEEAAIAVDKIIHYHDSPTLGEWRNNILFVADDEDGNLHMSDSEKLASYLNQAHPEFNTSKIYLDAYPQLLTPEESYPEAKEAIRRAVHTGELIVNYVGHASEDGLAHERVLTINDIDGWSNKTRLPLFVTATCEFSRWDMTMKRSAGEHLFFNANGGAIALFSATRLVYAAANAEINRSFFNHLFDKESNGKSFRLGDLMKMVKNESGGDLNSSKFCLIGDPALSLNFPAYHCQNLEMNDLPIAQFSGTVAPASKITITGEMQGEDGKRADFLNGSISAMVYDQPSLKQTLGNGSLPKFSYAAQENILFNGSVPVRNGIFSYSFVVPKDVNFNNNAGTIRYYFSDGNSDGNGAFSNIHFNGNNVPQVNDVTGPDIKLLLENDSFQDGATVSAAPLLKAYLKDESGINTSGIGIGHDITVVLDEDLPNRIVLNDYYQADAATWKSGAVTFPLFQLSEGAHSLTMKAWDNVNNSSSATIHFVVRNDLVIRTVSNFPNPFSEETRFVIRHNRYNESMQASLTILNLSGSLVYQLNRLVISEGYEINDLTFNPLNSIGSIAPGQYIYRIVLTASDGAVARGAGKLVFQNRR